MPTSAVMAGTETGPPPAVLPPGCVAPLAAIVPISSLCADPGCQGPIEAWVDHRADIADGGVSFRVRLRDATGSIGATFLGAAARALRTSPALREGGHVRLEGYRLVPVAGGVGEEHELEFGPLHGAVRVSRLGTCPGDPGETEAKLMPLCALSASTVGMRASVEATVLAVGDLELTELPLQPGEFLTTRSLSLQHGGASCDWVLWGEDAKRCGVELTGRRVVVHGAKVHQLKGKRHLTGCVHVDLRD